MVWPVADSLRNTRVLQFSNPKDGYTLNWDFWFSQLNFEDKAHLPLHEYNKTRLYFDFRIIPIRAADLHKLCANLEDSAPELAKTYVNRFQQTHFFHVVSGDWSKYDYNPVRERSSPLEVHFVGAAFFSYAYEVLICFMILFRLFIRLRHGA